MCHASTSMALFLWRLTDLRHHSMEGLIPSCSGWSDEQPTGFIVRQRRTTPTVPNENPVCPRMSVFCKCASRFLTFAVVLRASRRAVERGSAWISRPESAAGASSFELFRRLVVRSGDVARPPAAVPPLAPFPAAELVAARASPSPKQDASLLRDSTGNNRRGFDAARLHGTRSHDLNTLAEWNQLPAPRTLVAKASAARTALHGCPCLAPVLGSQGRR